MHVSEVPSNVPYKKANVPASYPYVSDDDYYVTSYNNGNYRMNSSEQTGSDIRWSKKTSELDIRFQGIDDNLPTDWYLFLTGEGAKMLRGETKMRAEMPTK
jgi:hypothetical protein